MWNWFEERLGLRSAFQSFLYKPLPERIGWPHVFGSMLLAVLAMQMLTGVLLSLSYAPSPLSAFRSVRYISYEIPGGAWLRGIHHWGASVMVVLVGLHLMRTFLYAAYRKPREATWMVGALLMLCVLTFAQTGYLLPWDQRAYWGTSVTIQIIDSVPWIGPKLAYFLRGGNVVGALTLSRFFTIHAVVLPLVTTLLVTIHLLLIQRWGITAPWTRTGEDAPRKTPFYPYQMARDSAGMLFIVMLLLLLAWLLPAPLGNAADPADNTFVPRPDWYFLFLFQLLRYFKGKSELIGTFLLPVIMMALVFGLPFLDRNPSRRLRNRPFALLALCLCLTLWGLLTYAAVQETPRIPSWRRPVGIQFSRSERIRRPSEVGGLYVLQQRCFECHSMTVLGARSNLQTLARRHFPSGVDWLQEHLAANHKERALSENELEELMSVLRLVAGERSELLYTIPAQARFGAHFFYNKSCIHCHKIDGQGGEKAEVKAPDLTLRLLRPKEWHIKHIHDAQSVVPHSKMPPFFHYEPREYDALAEYILYLHSS